MKVHSSLAILATPSTPHHAHAPPYDDVAGAEDNESLTSRLDELMHQAEHASADQVWPTMDWPDRS